MDAVCTLQTFHPIVGPDPRFVRRSQESVKMKYLSLALIAAVMLSGTTMAEEKKAAASAQQADSVHDFKMESLAGKEVDLSKYKGKVLLIVNVASRCGATPQYEPLQQLHRKYEDRGLVVMGFPCNQFGAQEPGSADEIQQFCKANYGVEFPMFAKINVNGDEQAPLYEFLKEDASDHSNVGWNFEKFVVGKDGKVAGRFKTRTQPDDPAVVKLIEEELAK